MPAWILELSIGGTMRVKVEAPDENTAMEIGEHYFIDDWENAGPLKLGDVHIDSVYEDSDETAVNGRELDASIIARGPALWEFATDDPYGRAPEEEDEPTDPAGH